MDVDNDDVFDITHLKRMDFVDVCEVALLARHHPKVSHALVGRRHVTEQLRRVPLSLGGNEEDLDRVNRNPKKCLSFSPDKFYA